MLFQDYQNFAISGSATVLEVRIIYQGKKPQIGSELSSYLKDGGQNAIVFSIPSEKEPSIYVTSNSLKISWKEEKIENSIFFVKDPPVYPIGPGDRLNVEVYGVEGINKEVVVDPQGFITLPLVERLSAKDMTLNDLQKHIEEKYYEYIQDPQINIQLREYGSRFVNVLGEVDSPRRISLKKALRLLDAISEAGGFTA
ncbi:MAG: polysaccharide biosynthesis/export family protein, partial [Acidobacteria bacterium]|nr:polysaccharide biosynthesis/export family protein [Acidobacteriota bacterium]